MRSDGQLGSNGESKEEPFLLQSLPNELLCQVVYWLSQQDRNHFSRVCRKFRAIEQATPLVLLRIKGRYSDIRKFKFLLSYLQKHPGIQKLYLMYTKITYQQLKQILKNIKLKVLDIYGCENLWDDLGDILELAKEKNIRLIFRYPSFEQAYYQENPRNSYLRREGKVCLSFY